MQNLHAEIMAQATAWVNQIVAQAQAVQMPGDLAKLETVVHQAGQRLACQAYEQISQTKIHQAPAPAPCPHCGQPRPAWAGGPVGHGLGQTRHMYLVFLAHSVLMRQLRQGRAREWARERLTTIGQACRTVLKETLSDTISWVVDRIHEGWNYERIKVQLALP